jgi:hypothetical protein
MMISRHTLFLACLLSCGFALPAMAAQDAQLQSSNTAEAKVDYWVVGSFKTYDIAEGEKNRLERLTGEQVEIVDFSTADKPRLRLLVRQALDATAQQQLLLSKSLAPWALAVSSRQLGLSRVTLAGQQGEAGKTYWLVLASFHGPDRARQLLAQLEQERVESVEVQRVEVDGRYLFRVCHGPFDQMVTSARSHFVALGYADAYWTTTNSATSNVDEDYQTEE